MTFASVVRLAALLACYLLLMLLVWLIMFDGIAANIVYSKHPRIMRSPTGHTSHNVVFVYFTGTQSSGSAHAAPMMSVWQQHADVVVVEYNPRRFDGPTIVSDTYQQLRSWGYRKVILDGASLGAMLATDLIDYDRSHGNVMQFAVIIQDGPTSADDLYQAKGARVMAYWHAGPVANFLFTRAFWAFGFKPPAKSTLGTGVDDGQLTRHYQASRTYPLSGWTAELRYIVTHRTYRAGEYSSIPLIVMRSQHDVVVRLEAARMWTVIFRGGSIIDVPDTTHIGFVEFPNVWRQAFEQGLRTLEPALKR